MSAPITPEERGILWVASDGLVQVLDRQVLVARSLARRGLVVVVEDMSRCIVVDVTPAGREALREYDAAKKSTGGAA